MILLGLEEAARLAGRALMASGASPAAAASTAAALVAAEADGQAGHGLSRIPSYAAQLKAGKIDGKAEPALTRPRPATVRIDARHGLAYPAVDLAVGTLPELAHEFGIASAGLFASHHIGQAGRVAERLAEQGLIALLMSNTPSAMAFAGGKRAMLGTNPLAFAAPMPGREPLVIDLALSLVARSKIVAAQKAGKPIPADWATDPAGLATTDPAAALAGALAPMGGPKGAALALMVEILCGALAGGHYGWEASSFLDDKGPPPDVGQILLAIDPSALSGPQFLVRMEDLAAAFADQAGVRIPGDRRLAQRERARRDGVSIAPDLHAAITGLAGSGVET
jgi:(2R)-3-sulfolactate dehydrogenase (NADP+)